MALSLSLLSMILALIVLIFNWKVNRNALFLSLLMILIASLQTRQYLTLYGKNPFWLAIIINNPAPLWSMIGPCLFFYVRNVLTDRMIFRKSDLLHTIPFWVTLAGTLPYMLTSFSYKLWVADVNIKNLNDAYHIRYNWLLNNQWNLFFLSVVQVGYAMASFWMLARFQRRQKQHAGRFGSNSGMIHKWLVAVSVFVLLTGLYYFSGAFLYFSNPSLARNFMTNDQWINVFGVLLTCLPFLVLIFPEILYGIPMLREMRAVPRSETGTQVPVGVYDPLESPAAPEVTPEIPLPEVTEADPFRELGQRVLDFMEVEKPYLVQDFTIEHLAEMLGVPKHHLYYCFKHILKQKFVQLRNKYRVEEAKRRLVAADLKETTLANIGFECGFSAHSSFYRIFTEHEGCTPGEFIERHNQQE